MSVKRWLQNRYTIGAGLAVLALAVYLKTLAPTVTFIDSGELASDVSVLGIAHPTGYPLFTLLGWLFVHIPAGLRPIFQLNVLAAILCASALFIFFQCFVLLLSSSFAEERTPLDQKSRAKISILIAAATGTLTLGFSETYWSEALSIEVYSLHLLLLSLVLLLFLKSLHEGGSPTHLLEVEAVSSQASWYGFAFVLGLSFVNHMTTILLVPGFLYLFFTTHRFSRQTWLKLLYAALPFLLGLSVYLYLPVRAAQHPVLNWGDPSSLERFIWHVTGKQYRVWILSSAETAIKQLKYFIDAFPSEFAYVPLVFALIGVIELYRSNRRVLYFTAILFLSCLLYSINYDIHDIDSYFLLAYIAVVVWIVFGARAFLHFAFRPRGLPLSSLVCLLIGLTPLSLHYERVDESSDYTVEDYTRNMFDSFEKNALVLSYQWDYFVSSSYYAQLVEGYRSDVTIVDKELLRRSWYFSRLEHQHPQLIEHSRREVDTFLRDLYKFEHGLPYDPAMIETRYQAMIQSFLVKHYSSGPVYVTPEIEGEYTRGFQKVPSGLAFRLYADTTYHEIPPKYFTFHAINKKDKYSIAIRDFYAAAYCNQGIYLAVGGKKDKAVELLRKSLRVTPAFPEALRWLKKLGAEP
jgi:hypothetical protein